VSDYNRTIMVPRSNRLAVLALLFAVPVSASPAGERIRGFTKEGSETERAAEESYRGVPRPESASRHLRRLTEDLHLAGTPGSHDTARYVHERFLEYGLESEMVSYDVLLSYPDSVKFELKVPEAFSGPTPEAGIPWDKDSFSPDAVAPFLAYSASGDVTAEVVYANYGLPEDFDELERQGVPLSGKIAIVRFGRCYRGVKVRVAESRGCAGVIIYSDPADDGYVRGDVYPKGPWRPETAVQRGSIQYVFLCPGDPLTPGWPSIPGERRIDAAESLVLPKIPAIAISYGDARRILQNIEGQNVPRAWQGGLPFAYHCGPGPALVRLDVKMKLEVRKIWNVIGTLPGSSPEEKDQIVLMGNHRDAWCYGAVDPSSGTAVLLEVARGLGALRKEGRGPRRTLKLCSWDAEEYGLVGSVEWAEHHAKDLSENAVAYVNCDAAVSGPNVGFSASPSLGDLAGEIAAHVTDPRSGKTIEELARERGGPAASPVSVGTLGSGSDFTAFLDHLGIACFDLSSVGPYGVYHSIYDSYAWMSRFGDPTFEYHCVVAKLAGTLLLRLGNADVLPFDLGDDGAKIVEHAAAVEKLREGTTLEDLKRQATTLEVEGRALAEAVEAALEAGTLGPEAARKVSRVLAAAERGFIDERGLVGRPWYRHLVVAPGVNAGYAAESLPGLRDAVSSGDAAAIAREKARLLEAIGRVIASVREARKLVAGGELKGEAR